MKLLNPYISYIGSIKPDICEKIISLGLSKIETDKKKGIKTTATTINDKQKKISDSERNKVLENVIASDKMQEEIKKAGSELDKSYIRDSEICWLKDKFIYDIFLPLIGDANKKAGWNWHIDTAETFQFTVYHGRIENGGFYGWHSDGFSDFNNTFMPAMKINDSPLRFKPPKKNTKGLIVTDDKSQPEPDMSAEDLPLKKDRSGLLHPLFTEDKKKWGKVRKISMTVNLTDPKNYDGGNLKFDLGPYTKKDRFKICDDIRPQGSAIVFPSFTYHCITPVTKGTRYSLVLWCLGKPWQ
jgi:hypothetical protein